MSYTPVVYFISTQYLRQNTPIEDNVDDDKIIPYIVQAQDTYLQQSIGETGYNALKSAVQNNTLTSDEQTFMRNYVQPLVAQYTFFLALPFITFKATNKSLSKESSEYSQPAELEELKYLRSNVKDVAEFYQRRMVKWLLDHPGTFTWYDSPDPLDNLNKTAQSYFSGIYIPYGVGRGNLRTWSEPYGQTYPCEGPGWCRGNNC
jgi:hypothetical protein